MKITAENNEQRGAMARFLRALPVAVGAIVICVIKIGPAATAVVLVAAVAGLALVLRLLTKFSFRHYNALRTRDGVEFRAEASMRGTSGLVRLSGHSLNWVPRRGATPSLTVPISEIAEVNIAPVRSILINATRLRFTTNDGREIKMTATAPAEAVEQALRSV